MPKKILKCCCRPNYKCSAPLHGKIEIITCEKNCKLGCADSTNRKNKVGGNSKKPAKTS